MTEQQPVDTPLRLRHDPAATATGSPFDALTRMGEILTVQLLFVVASLPIVTVLPAAVALQRSVHDLAVHRSGRPVASFARNLRWSLPRLWLLGVVLALGSIAGVVAFGFWSSVPGIARWLGVGVIGGLAAAVTATYLALLAAVISPRLAPDADRSALIDLTLDLLRRRTSRIALATVLAACWLAVLLQLPTVALVGSGLVPAGIVWVTVARCETRTVRAGGEQA